MTLPLNLFNSFAFTLIFTLPEKKPGKGDLVGCDISLNLLHNGQLTGGGGQGGQDFILKSSSDVKVGQINFSGEARKIIVPLAGINVL